MKKYFISGLLIAIIPCMCFGASPQYSKLVREKQRKMAELEKCMGSTKGLKIAGLSTLGLTAVGVVGNVAEAKKIQEYQSDIDSAVSQMEKIEKDKADVNKDIANLNKKIKEKEEKKEKVKEETEARSLYQKNCKDSGGTPLGYGTCICSYGFTADATGLCVIDFGRKSNTDNAAQQTPVNPENPTPQDNDNLSSDGNGGGSGETGGSQTVDNTNASLSGGTNDNDTTCEEDGLDYLSKCVCTGGTVNPLDGGCTCPNNLDPNADGSCPKDNGQQRQVTTSSKPKPTAPRENTTTTAAVATSSAYSANSDQVPVEAANKDTSYTPTYNPEDVISTNFFKDKESCLAAVNRIFDNGIGATCVYNPQNEKWDLVYTLHAGDPCTCPSGKVHEHDKTCKYGKFGSPYDNPPFVSFTCWAVTCEDGYHISDHICVEDR